MAGIVRCFGRNHSLMNPMQSNRTVLGNLLLEDPQSTFIGQLADYSCLFDLGFLSDRWRYELCRQCEPGPLLEERHPDLLCPEGRACEGAMRERLCETGTCAGSCYGDGGIIRHAEGALLLAPCQSQKEGDRDPVHLLLHPHCERGATGGEVDGATVGGSRIVGKPRRFRNGVLERELPDDGRKTTRNPGDEARTKRKNDIKRRV